MEPGDNSDCGMNPIEPSCLPEFQMNYIPRYSRKDPSGDVMNSEWFERHKGWSMPEREWLELQEFGRAQVRERALRALRSADSHARRTAATVCGQEKYQEAIPALKDLLLDDAHVLQGGPPWRKMFYIRKAARDALHQMGQTLDNVVLEAPDERWNKTEHRTNASPSTNQLAPLHVPD